MGSRYGEVGICKKEEVHRPGAPKQGLEHKDLASAHLLWLNREWVHPSGSGPENQQFGRCPALSLQFIGWRLQRSPILGLHQGKEVASRFMVLGRFHSQSV